MNLIESLLSGILAALFVATVTAVAGHYQRKARIHRGLVTDINLHLSGAQEAREFLERLFASMIREGRELTFDQRYHFGRYTLYESLQSDLVRYLSRQQLASVIEVYHRFWELECSLSGMVELMSSWTEEGRVLSADDIGRLERTKQRQLALIEILAARKLARLQDLPTSFESRIEPAKLILDQAREPVDRAQPTATKTATTASKTWGSKGEV